VSSITILRVHPSWKKKEEEEEENMQKSIKKKNEKIYFS